VNLYVGLVFCEKSRSMGSWFVDLCMGCGFCVNPFGSVCVWQCLCLCVRQAVCGFVPWVIVYVGGDYGV
jgi:hypothetical protein